ncbi:MAG: YkgJ family cysteine cluster protein [Gammaproteobacteria bacterium]|nr:YkgJ family cysteine cluster protein [Gammaproteobacteria bacterium]
MSNTSHSHQATEGGSPQSEQAARFLDWLSTVTAASPEKINGNSGLSLIELAELACAYAERSFERAGGAERLQSVDCRRGCDYCCHLPVESCRAEASRALEYAREKSSEVEFGELKRRIREAAAAYPLPPGRPPAENPRCPFLKDSACLVYPARPLACRGWNSRDRAACRSAYELGVQRAKVPVDTRIRSVFCNASEALLRGLTVSGRDGPAHLVPALAALILLEPG